MFIGDLFLFIGDSLISKEDSLITKRIYKKCGNFYKGATKMKWQDIPPVWQECFNVAWQSFQEGSRPIGAVVTDNNGEIIARGKSAAFNELTDCVISHNELAHAEINALLKLDNRIHTARQKYTL